MKSYSLTNAYTGRYDKIGCFTVDDNIFCNRATTSQITLDIELYRVGAGSRITAAGVLLGGDGAAIAKIPGIA